MSFRSLITYAVALIAASSYLGAATAQGLIVGPPPPLAPGTTAPQFATKTVSGQSLTLKSLRGKVVLIDYWATWCGPCRHATPTMQALHKKFYKQGLRVVGMSLDDSTTLSHVKPFMRKYGMTYAVAASPAANRKAAIAYRVDGIPSQYLIDKHGIVRWSQAGYSPTEGAELTQMIKLLLAEK